MTFEKIKNELKLFFSWKQLKEELKAFRCDNTTLLLECNVNKEQIKEYEKIWNVYNDNMARFMIRICIFLTIIVLIIA